MTLSNDRIIARGVSAHPHEREAVDFAIRVLPDREPLRLWALVDLVDTAGRRYDLDLVVIGYHAVYLIEIKSHPGTISGDVVDWVVDFPEGRRASLENPVRLTTHKARVLGSMLDRAYGQGRPYVQPLVFLSAPKVTVKLEDAALQHVVTCHNFERAITFGEFPGVPPRLLSRPIDRPTAQRTTAALKKLGLHASAETRKVGDLVLSNVILDRPTYQDHSAHHERVGERARVRTYQVPLGGGEERRQQIVRAAEREARTLSVLSDHPNILRLKTYVADGPSGAPCVVFEDFKDSEPLDAFLRTNPTLSLDDRTSLLQLLADALAYCHRKKVLHRGLAPSSVLVRRHPDDARKLELRLFNFQLATASETTTSGTIHLSTWFGANEDVYVAPEVLERPGSATEASDMFSFGAIAYFVLTGRAPGENLTERETLMRPGYLSLATAQDTFAVGVLPADVLPNPEATHTSDLEYVMQQATAQKSLERESDVSTWVEMLLEALTAPRVHEVTKHVDPLEARKGDIIAADMQVDAVLGTGSTARTLRIRTQAGTFALKVALSADQDERVRREGQVLRELANDRIVRLFDALEIAGRACLRMTDAGVTLAKKLADEGVPNLDFARRWGEDLLLALSHLEERGIQHRDIKPGNLGVAGADQKKKEHLFLFDFSLSSADAKDVRAGTPAYRDPFLAIRGRWDDAADRYATAITLHEVLTGERPRWGDGDIASATDSPITLSAERFDAGVREHLVAFFTRALARKTEARFSSADDMRSDWSACFATNKPIASGDHEDVAVVVAGPLPIDLSLDTPLAALPLPALAKNALDRSGVLRVRELLALPNNELSVMRGIGRIAAKQIVELTQRPELHALRAVLDAKPPTADPPGAPSVLHATLDHFLPAAKNRGEKPLSHVRVVFGLDAVAGQYVDSVAQAAAALRVTRTLIYTALGQRRELWKQASPLAELQRRVAAIVDANLSMAPLDTVAEALARELGALPAEGGDRIADDAMRQARALCRVVLETESDLKLARVNDTLWLVPEALEPRALAELGALADTLAQADPLLSAGAIEDRLRASVTPAAGKTHILSQVPSHRLVALAALASKNAAKSARLELYPRGLSHVRALDLCVTALPATKLSPEFLRNVVHARYPEAEPLPDGLELRALMQARGYRFDHANQTFERARVQQEASTQAPLTRQSTVHTTHRTGPDPDAYQFTQDINVRKKRGTFCVLEVVPWRAVETARELCHRLGVSPVSLEQRLLAQMHAQVQSQEIDPAVVYATDRLGPTSGDWPNLRELMRLSAHNLLDELAQRNEPLVLTDPGLLARFALSDFVKSLIDRTRSDDAPATFLIVPVTEEAGGARIRHPEGDLALPITSQAQRLRVPETWLENLDQQ